MQIKEILDLVSDELRDGKSTKYSRSSLLVKLKEGLTQFVQDSKILKKTVYIPAIHQQAIYDLPIFGKALTTIDSEEAIVSGNTTATTTLPTYLSLIRASWRDKLRTGVNRVMRSDSTFERDEAGIAKYQEGPPLYTYNDELSFYQFGIWPVPTDGSGSTANIIDADGSGGTDKDRRIQLDYVRDVLYYSNATNTTLITDLSTLTEDHFLDNGIPLQFQRKLYLLICFLRLKNSIDPTDVQKAANYKQLYETELLEEALRSGSHMERYSQLKVQS